MITEQHDIHGNVIDASQDAVDAIVRRGPGGAMAVAAVSVALVVAIWIAFYTFVFLPRN